MKASELKNKGVKIRLQDKEYELKFDMNTFCELDLNISMQNREML